MRIKASKIALACLILLLLFSQTGASEGRSISSLEQVQDSIWKIEDENLSRGTAFPIASHVFVTNYHVIAVMRNSSEIRLFRERISLNFKRLLAVSALYDLAIFETQEPVSLYFEVIKERPEPDEALFTSGYPQGHFEQIQKTGDLIHYKHYEIFPVDRDDLGGASGSPIFDQDIRVVGVLKGGVENFAYLIRSSRVEELMEGQIGLKCGEFLKECVERELEALKTMAEQGLALAQYNLALMYKNGEGVERNLQEAFSWYRKVAEQGLALAQYNLAYMYYRGEGVERNFQKAFEWFHKVAEQGLALAQYNLAVMYYNGKWRERSFGEAFEWYRRAAEQGYAPAQYNLAIMHYNGAGIEKNIQEAFSWYRRAAEQGYAKAQYNLAIMHYNGAGIEKNIQEAFSWYRRAAEQGYAKAQYNLAQMYYHGEGIEKNLQEAHYWVHKASEQGHARAYSFRDLIEEELNTLEERQQSRYPLGIESPR